MIFFGKSDIGQKRKTNQDNFYVKQLTPRIVLAVVCDGMGGANGGNVASEIAIHSFCERMEHFVCETIGRAIAGGDITAALAHAIVGANSAVYAKSTADPALSGMGTTLVAAFIVENTLYILNIGDSRLYRINPSEIRQMTTDHSLVQHLIDIGDIRAEDAATYPHKNVIMRAVGIQSDIRVDISSSKLDDDSPCWLLLCSDGLSGTLKPDQIQSIVCNPSPQQSVEQKVDELIAAANAAGGPDNITAVLLRTDKFGATEGFSESWNHSTDM